MNSNPEAALLLKPGFELDVFIYRYVFDGIIEAAETPSGKVLERPIPSFSRRSDAAKSLLIKMVMENRGVPVLIDFGDEICRDAVKAGHVNTDKNVPVWKVSMGDLIGYGRSIEEAICKLAIVARMSDDKV